MLREEHAGNLPDNSTSDDVPTENLDPADGRTGTPTEQHRPENDEHDRAVVPVADARRLPAGGRLRADELEQAVTERLTRHHLSEVLNRVTVVWDTNLASEKRRQADDTDDEQAEQHPDLRILGEVSNVPLGEDTPVDGD